MGKTGDIKMHPYGEKICTVRPKIIYFIGMSLAGIAFMVYGLKTNLIPVVIPGALICAYGVTVIFWQRIVFYTDAIIVYRLGPTRVLRANEIDRIIWHKQVPYNMAIAAQRKPAVKCAVVMKNGPSTDLDCGLYGKLEDCLREYAGQIGVPSEEISNKGTVPPLG